MLETEVERSNAVAVTLAQDGLSLHETLGEHQNIHGNVNQAKKKLNKYQKRQKMDRIIMYLATMFFFSVVFYIVFQRVRIPFLLW
ncbi:unnamed protein product [Heterosigma akashiwo]